MSGASATTIIAGRAYVLIEAVDKTGRVLSKIGQGIKKLSKITRGLRKMLNVLDQVGRKLRKIGMALDKFGSQLMGKGLRMLFMGGSASIPIVGAINQAKDYSDAMLGLQAVLKATTKEMEPLDKIMRKLGATTSFTSKEIAMAAQQLARGGFSRSEIVDSIESVLDLARSGQVDLSSASLGMVRAIRSFKMTAADSTRVADSFFEAARLGTSTVYELQSALSFSAGTARLMGFSLEQTLGVLSQMANSMLVGTKGGTSFNQMLLRMGTESDQVRKKLGFEVFDQMTGDLKDPLMLMGELSKAASKMGKQDMLETFASIFNVRGLRAAAVVAEYEKIEDAIKTIEQANGSAKEAAKIMDSGIGGSIRKILSALNNLSIAFGSTFAKPIDDIKEKLIPILEGLGKWIQKHEDLGRKVLIAVGGFLALGAAFIALGIAVKIAAIAFLGFGTLVSAATFLAPLIIKLGIITAILKGFQFLPGNIGKAFASLETNLLDTFNGILRIAGKAFDGIKDRILAGDVEGAMNILMVSLLSIFELGWIGLKESWLNFTFFMQSEFINAIGGVKVAWNQMQNWLSKKMLDFAADNEFFNWLFKQISGVDVKVERARSAQLGNTENTGTAILDKQLKDKNNAVIREQNLRLAKLTEETEKLRAEYGKKKTEAEAKVDLAIKMGKIEPRKEDKMLGKGGVMMPTFILDGKDGLGSKVAAGKVSGFEMGSKEALTKAMDNEKKMLNASLTTATNVKKMTNILDERLPEMEGV